jgi:RNase P subunit RPR2
MTLKDDGKVSNKTKRKRHKTQKCTGCKNVLDIDSYIERNDFDKVDNETIIIYCEKCGNEELIKL